MSHPDEFVYQCDEDSRDSLTVAWEQPAQVWMRAEAGGRGGTIVLSKADARDLSERLARWTGVTPGAARVPATAPSRPVIATLTIHSIEDVIALADELVELVRADEHSDVVTGLSVASRLLKAAEAGR